MTKYISHSLWYLSLIDMNIHLTRSTQKFRMCVLGKIVFESIFSIYLSIYLFVEYKLFIVQFTKYAYKPTHHTHTQTHIQIVGFPVSNTTPIHYQMVFHFFQYRKLISDKKRQQRQYSNRSRKPVILIWIKLVFRAYESERE